MPHRLLSSSRPQLTPKPRPGLESPEATRGRYVAGVGFQVAGRTVQALAALGTLIVLSRHLDLAGVGLYGAYLALYALLDVAVDAGSGLALVRRISARPTAWQGSLRAALRFRCISILAACAPAIGYALLDVRGRDQGAWGLVATASLLGHLPGTYAAIYQVRLRFALPSLARGGCAAAAFAAVLVLAGLGCRDPLAFLCVTLAGRVSANVLIWLGARGLLPAPDHEAAARDPGFVTESLTLGLGGLLREGYGRLDVLLLRFFLGAEAAGLYAPCRAAVNLALILPSYILTVALPPLSARARSSPHLFLRRCRRLALGLAAVAAPAAAASLPFVPWLLLVLFGEDWLPAAPALRLLAAAAALAWPGSAFLTGLVARGGAADALRASALALVANLALNLVLIPTLGLPGAALARVAAELAMLGAASLLLARGLDPATGGGHET